MDTLVLAPVFTLFGAAEKGQLDTAYYCNTLSQLFEHLGEPPDETQGLFFAVQALLYGYPLLYFRVKEEGTSIDDYLFGLMLLQDPHFPVKAMQALFLPGVGSKKVLEEGIKLCQIRQSILIMNETDFYDYLTEATYS